MVVHQNSSKITYQWRGIVHVEERSQSRPSVHLEPVGNGEKSPEIEEYDCRRRWSRFAPLEVQSERGEVGNVTSIARRTDRRLHLVERWPETRRRGRGETVARARKKKGKRRREKKGKRKGRKESGLGHSGSIRTGSVRLVI
ncbi:hypothetical protein JCGZ_03262 [Jatropha curcas]|uniref:Uncharacterized protein n=1 Tax=Jatropha curcas TaxID=180498 RepID=A0A067KRH0_JATCU|nr:hypothetical protein JCGZ_09173 [Jatropha curcas]KDP42051.1 hypothetical protein JCGZ_03262 [Jatropha curcas]